MVPILKNLFLMRVAIIFFWLLCLGAFLWFPTIDFFKRDNVINIFVWPATIDYQVIKAFERETGIKVNITYFDSNEELFIKLYSTNGQGYDMYMPTDYSMHKFIEYNLAKPLDKTKLDFLPRLNPRLLHQYFDPENVYSIPYFWAIYGLGIDKEFFGNRIPPSSWSLLFDYPLGSAKIGMINVALEAVLITAKYRFGTIDVLTPDKLDQITTLLIDQKKRVESYIDTDVRSTYLLTSRGSPVVVTVSPFIAKIMKEYPRIDFLVPQEGSFVIIDNILISSACKRDHLVYTFINFLYRPENLLYHAKKYPFIPTTTDMSQIMKEAGMPQSIIDIHMDDTLLLHFFKTVLPETIVDSLWVMVKTS